MNRRVGVLFVVVSAVSFGIMPIFAIAAYESGVDPVTLLFLRFAAAGVCMILIAIVRREKIPAPSLLVGLALMGGVGYVGQSLSYFYALKMADAGLVALLLYLYPVIVALLSAIFLRERLDPPQIVAVAAAFIGTALTVGPQPGGTAGGIVLGIAAAFIYSCYIMVGNRLLAKTSPITASAVIKLSAAAVFGALCAAKGSQFPQTGSGWAAVIAVALVSTVVASTAFLIGLKAIGPTRASVISTFEPVVTVAASAVFLAEPLSAVKIAGGVMIVGAAVFLSARGAPAAAE